MAIRVLNFVKIKGGEPVFPYLASHDEYGVVLVTAHAEAKGERHCVPLAKPLEIFGSNLIGTVRFSYSKLTPIVGEVILENS